LFFAIPYRRCGAHYAYRALQRQPLFQGKLLESDCLVRLRTAWRYIRQLLFTLCFSPPYSHSFVVQDEIRNSTIVVGN
ncbi:hypothetical protein ACQYEF_003745, partial [Escherichia coli]